MALNLTVNPSNPPLGKTVDIKFLIPYLCPNASLSLIVFGFFFFVVVIDARACAIVAQLVL